MSVFNVTSSPYTLTSGNVNTLGTYRFNLYKEVLKVILLDTKNKPISVKDISVGTLNSSLVHPREVFKEAIKESAYSIILVHNHPSGDCKPSDEDKNITERLSKLGDELGIKVLDHIILGKKDYWSYLDKGA